MQAHDGKAIGDELVTLLEETTGKLAALATEQRQHTSSLLDAHPATVTELIEHGRYARLLACARTDWPPTFPRPLRGTVSLTLAARDDRRAALRTLAAAEKNLSDAGSDRPAWCAWLSEAVMWSVYLFQPESVSRHDCCLVA
ncbi:hypothetical protein ABZ890_41970 [Streptomyces sp. NPDC046984]|uniref:hypothetical protein n=1 Tax=Streptomyces sp. NPDC046984 TaxID=3155138 RepID=UPI0033C59298